MLVNKQHYFITIESRTGYAFVCLTYKIIIIIIIIILILMMRTIRIIIIKPFSCEH